MLRKINFTLFACFFVWNAALADQIDISFYSEQLSIEYDPAIKLPGLVIADEISLEEYYTAMRQTPFESLLQSLDQEKQRLQLNDWLYFELLHDAIEEIYFQEMPLKRTLTCWFLLSEAGFDTRITYLDYTAFVYVWSEDTVFETPLIMDQGKAFVNLSSIISREKQLGNQLNLLRYRPRETGKTFTFRLQKLPLLKTQLRQKTLSFVWRDRKFKLDIATDHTIYELMQHYPLIEEHYYLEVPLSKTLAASLLPKIKALLKDKSPTDALEILVALTRSGFQYKDDKAFFGHGKPMIADELFHYPYSDCEDRSALFYSLVKTLLDLPMLVIAYPDHLTIAVASPHLEGLAIPYNSKNYFICDPTGPLGSSAIGMPPIGYENIGYEILGFYSSSISKPK